MFHSIEMVNKNFELQVVNSDVNEFIIRILNRKEIIANMIVSPAKLKQIRDVLSKALQCDCDEGCCCDLQEYVCYCKRQITSHQNSSMNEITTINFPAISGVTATPANTTTTSTKNLKPTSTTVTSTTVT